MAWEIKYQAGWNSLRGLHGYLYIEEEDYSGTITDITLKHNSIEVSYGFQDWNDPVIGMTAVFSIWNDKADFYELLPLLTTEEGEYRIRIVVTSPTEYTIFEGFLNCDTITQKMLHKQEISFAASSYLSKLEYKKPPSIETLENVFFINVINEILQQTGSTYNIRVNCSLTSQNCTLLQAQTLFNTHAFYTELFWKDNVERKNSLEILRSILKSFDCYLYWFEGYWYIDRYEDIWCNDSALEQGYVEYDYTKTYGDADDSVAMYDEGTYVEVQKTLTDLHSFTFRNNSQLISIIPGYKQIEIQLAAAHLLNVIMPDLTNTESVVFGIIPYPNIRTWQGRSDGSVNFWFKKSKGKPKYTIKNSIEGLLQDPDWDGTTGGDGADYVYAGLYTRFKVNVSSDSEGSTQLNIKWKYGTYLDAWLEAWRADNDCITFTAYWYLRQTPGNSFIVQNSLSGDWASEALTELTGIQEIQILGSAFKEVGSSGWVWTEIEQTIPLGEVVGLSDGDATFVLGIGVVKREREAPFDPYYTWGHYGDFEVTISEADMDNVITGEITSKFLNKKVIDLDLFDVTSLNYKNGIYYNEALTALWSDGNSSVVDSLVDRLLKNKFQLFNRSRQKITSDVEYSGLLRPLQMFYDSKQSNKPFLLMSYTYKVMSDEYYVELFEYDNTTEITLVE